MRLGLGLLPPLGHGSGFGSFNDTGAAARTTTRLKNSKSRRKGRRKSSSAQDDDGCFSTAAHSCSIPYRIPITTTKLSTAILYFTLILAIAIGPISAVQINFQNCLPNSYRQSEPRLLQWVPLHADAVYDTTTDKHNLQVIVWGNVTGSRSNQPLPPPDSVYWKDPAQTEGKIVEIPAPDAATLNATTLIKKVDVLDKESWRNRVNLCTEGFVNGTCPLGPVFPGQNIDFPYNLPSINISHDFFSEFATFSSVTSTFLIIYGDPGATNIGCVSTTITPYIGSISNLLKFLPLMILALTGLGVIIAAIWSPWGTTNIFHWTTNYGRDADLLRLVTPGFGDCLQYIQFILLSGSLSLDYPGFYQPIVSQLSWSSLMFNQSIVTNSDPWQSVVDGIYVTNSSYGLQRNGQLVGMAMPEDIWAGMMAWICTIIVGTCFLIQTGFLLQWVYRKIVRDSEEDLRDKNLPFTIGNIVRIVFGYFLLPLVSLSTFQLVVSWDSPKHTVALASLTIIILVVSAVWLLWIILRTRPRAVLFDDLPTVLRYGPLYNTYSDHSAPFALIPMVLTFLRGIAIGAVQPSGIAQVVLLAICEVVFLLSLLAFRPFHPPTSMNAYQAIFSCVRLVTIMLMVAFAQPLGVSDGSKGWIGYAILLLHAIVLVLGFFINALQTLFEVGALMLGAGGDDDRGLTRGGLSKIFGMRQLSRRVIPRGNEASRISYLSTSGMLEGDDGIKSGYSMPNGRLRSDSAGSISGMLNSQRSPSAYDGYSGRHRHMDSGSSYYPGTPAGETSVFSFLGSPTGPRGQYPAIPLEAADPYYRPPRRRRDTINDDGTRPDSLRDSFYLDSSGRSPQGLGVTVDDAADAITDASSREPDTRNTELRPPEISRGADISRGVTPAPGALNSLGHLTHRPDYSTREVDFYYGVRGPALNSDAPGRRLGTGPADPTGPVATASGWFRNMFGGKTKEKGKGFEVVRSARMPLAMMARNGAGFGDETPPEGIPVAMGVLRNGPIDSDDDEPRPKKTTSPKKTSSPKKIISPKKSRGRRDHEEVEEEDDSPITERLPRGSLPPPPRILTQDTSRKDEFTIPRRSSKRNSALVEESSLITSAPSQETIIPNTTTTTTTTTTTRGPNNNRQKFPRLPFERSESQNSTPSSVASWSAVDTPPADDHRPNKRSHSQRERPTSFGMVSQHSIDVELSPVDLLGDSAELVMNGDDDDDGRRNVMTTRKK